MSNFIYISNGVDIDPTWDEVIAISVDGTKWSTVPKNQVKVSSEISNTENSESGSEQSGERVVIKNINTGGLIARFLPSEVKNQSWTSIDDAEADINSWVSTNSSSGLTNVQLRATPIETYSSGVKYLFSTVNSTSSQLAAGNSFVGTIESVILYPSISFLAFADQNLTITIDQFIDAAGTKISESRVFSYAANEKLGISYPINGNYVRVTVKNEGGSTTTTLQVDTAYGEIESTNLSQDDYLRGEAARTAVVNNILTPVAGSAPTDVTKFRSFTCQVVSTGTGGTFIFEGSNDGTNFQSIPVYNQALAVRVPIITAITATNSQIIYEGSCNFKFIRLRIATTITGGSIQSHALLSHESYANTLSNVSNGTAANLLMTAAQSGTWTVMPGNTVNTTPWLANPLTPTISSTGDTGSKTATGNGATVTNTTSKGALITITLSSVTGTTPTGVFKLQSSADGGTNFVDIPGATTATLNAAGTYGIMIYPGIAAVAGVATTGTSACVNATLPRQWRVVWTIGGGTPAFVITSINVSYII